MHEFKRPEANDQRQVGQRWSHQHDRYEEGVRYVYRHGAHELTLFWNEPAPDEIRGLRDQPVEVGLFLHPPAAFLLYKINNVCEWSDVAFNIHLVHENEREMPNESPGDRARLKIDLVNAADGVILARRIVSLDKVMTQALKHAMREQAGLAFDREDYDEAVRMIQHRYPDSDALVRAAEFVEATLG
jgi:hypothetical protein